MPTPRQRRCTADPYCPNPAGPGGPCPSHRNALDRERKRGSIYNTKRWQRIRRLVLAREPNCRQCGAPALDVDHIIAIEDGGAPYSARNLQPLCKECHGTKTRTDQRERQQG